MVVEKAFIYAIDCPITKSKRTLLMQRYFDNELISKFEIVALDGEYKTRTQFHDAYEECCENIKRGTPVEKNFDLISFYGADFREFIEKCESLEKE